MSDRTYHFDRKFVCKRDQHTGSRGKDADSQGTIVVYNVDDILHELIHRLKPKSSLLPGIEENEPQVTQR